jgi:type I restriction enzyme S subunit
LSSLQHPIHLATERQISDAGVAKISSGVLPIDTVLLSSRAPVGYLALAKVPTAVNHGFIVHWFHTNMEEIKGRASGTTFAAISKTAFRPIPAMLPSPVLIEGFEDITKPMFDSVTHLVRESARFAVLRDYRLPRVLSGRERVKNDSQVDAIA